MKKYAERDGCAEMHFGGRGAAGFGGEFFEGAEFEDVDQAVDAEDRKLVQRGKQEEVESEGKEVGRPWKGLST